MGHCLGLDHEDNVDPLPVMRTALSRGTVVRQLTADDVAGRNSIYSVTRAAPGSPAPTPAPVSTGDGGGGGGCSLIAGHPTDAAVSAGRPGESRPACGGAGAHAYLDTLETALRASEQVWHCHAESSH